MPRTAGPRSLEEPPKGGESVLVCRPKVGVRIQGGGFVAVWRRVSIRHAIEYSYIVQDLYA
jgi:hypothetical protein